MFTNLAKEREQIADMWRAAQNLAEYAQVIRVLSAWLRRHHLDVVHMAGAFQVVRTDDESRARADIPDYPTVHEAIQAALEMVDEQNGA